MENKLKQVMIDVESCMVCPFARNENPRLYCFTCAKKDNRKIHDSNTKFYGGFIPDWCPLDNKDDILFVVKKGEVDAIHWSHGDIYLAEMHEDE